MEEPTETPTEAPTAAPTEVTTVAPVTEIATQEPTDPDQNGSCDNKVVCYYPNWAHWRTGNNNVSSLDLFHSKTKLVCSGEGNFKLGDIDVNMCTHLVYAFAVLDPTSHTMKVFDEWLDVSLENYKNYVALKEQNKKLKTLIAIGGWTDSQNNAAAYKALFASQTLIENFAK